MSLNGMFIAALAVLVVQQPRTATVQGVVVKAGTSDPVAKAVVQLRTNTETGSSAIATGGDGKFEFRNLAPGSYQLTVSRDGYLDSAYGQRGPNSRGRPLVAGAGQTVKDIRLIMVPTGAISGRVYDNSSEPLANISVGAFKYSYVGGRQALKPVKTVETNDRGEYRLFWLAPGQYYVSAMPSASEVVMESDGRLVPRTVSSAEKLGETYLPIYYPGTADPQTATPVDLHPGADLTGIDVTLERVTPRRVRGIVLDNKGQPATPVSGDPNRYARGAQVALVPRGASIATTRRAGASVFDGTFEIQGVLPGSYFLVATRYMDSGRADGPTFAGARVPIDVRSSDLDRLSIILPPVISIAGQVTVEGFPGGFAGDVPPIVTLKSELLGIPTPIHRFDDTVGKQFIIDGLIEGDYQVQVTRLPEGAYVKSVRFGAPDALNGGLHIDSQTSDRIQVVLGANAGVLDGAVIDKNREPVANATVALIPDAAHRQRTDLYRNVSANESGRFHLQDIPPGDYVLFAWEDIEEGLWRDSEFIRRSEGSGKPIRILEGSHASAEVSAVPFAF